MAHWFHGLSAMGFLHLNTIGSGSFFAIKVQNFDYQSAASLLLLC